MAVRRLVIVLLALLGAGCTVTSIDAQFDRALKACEAIVDERARGECVATIYTEFERKDR